MDGKKVRERVLVAIAVIATLAVVMTVGFYQEEVLGYLRLQGWNLQPVEQATKEFVAAAAKGDGATVARMVAGPSDGFTPIRNGDQISGFELGQYGGPKPFTLKQLVPSADPQISRPRLVFQNGGSVEVSAQFPGTAAQDALEFRWDRVQDTWKLKGITKPSH